MNPVLRASAEKVRSLLLAGAMTPTAFRASLLTVPFVERDAWTDVVLGIESVPDDAPLPLGCVPYLPCSVDALMRMIDLAEVKEGDVFVDVGSGIGRAAAFVHLLTGASVTGIELQPALARQARVMAAQLKLTRFSQVEGDVTELMDSLSEGTVFFLYCPFGDERLNRVLNALESIAQAGVIRICTVDLPLPERSWLKLRSTTLGDLAIYEGQCVAHATIPRRKVR